MVASETRCADDECDCMTIGEFCGDFCLLHGEGEHEHTEAHPGLRLRSRGLWRRRDLGTPRRLTASQTGIEREKSRGGPLAHRPRFNTRSAR